MSLGEKRENFSLTLRQPQLSHCVPCAELRIHSGLVQTSASLYFQISELVELASDAGHVLQRAAGRVHVRADTRHDPVSQLAGEELQAEQV